VLWYLIMIIPFCHMLYVEGGNWFLCMWLYQLLYKRLYQLLYKLFYWICLCEMCSVYYLTSIFNTEISNHFVFISGNYWVRSWRANWPFHFPSGSKVRPSSLTPCFLYPRLFNGVWSRLGWLCLVVVVLVVLWTVNSGSTRQCPRLFSPIFPNQNRGSEYTQKCAMRFIGAKVGFHWLRVMPAETLTLRCYILLYRTDTEIKITALVSP